MPSPERTRQLALIGLGDLRGLAGRQTGPLVIPKAIRWHGTIGVALRMQGLSAKRCRSTEQALLLEQRTDTSV